jgi:hypothetical protein
MAARDARPTEQKPTDQRPTAIDSMSVVELALKGFLRSRTK